MRTREDILSELAELKAHPAKSYSGSMLKTAQKNQLMSELGRIETEEHFRNESNQHNFQFDNLEINISITKK
ncbi:hypothetical protein P3U62_11095 [Mammaliicoccus vitulinus]|uniref:hypothetical protein n=1 Tax=Mammaliicoccus vitulinus TaxID=71237 RepID=UPI002B259619|nr:hypothetical protein [Mammaliicoccus vitulinus]WQK87579.1 hypothetical protein P3U62_11095 [Mammaliicoccus vitulinus]